MSSEKHTIKEKLLKAAAYVEHNFVKAKHAVKVKLNMLDPVMIMPYYGYGNDTCVFLKGRVLEKENIKEKEHISNWRKVKNIYRRYESDEIPGARVKGMFGGKELEVQTDDEGFFELEFRFDEPIDYERVGNTVKLQMLDQLTPGDITEAEGKIFYPHPKSEFGIISDIDDTVLVSNITHMLDKLKMMLLKDATERSPFPGIAAFLQSLCSGCDETFPNPLFFVSGSEWNLFDLLDNFFRYHEIPGGPLLLRDRGTRFDKPDVAPSEKEYKISQVSHLLETFPHLKFICIGDSGQHDPEIYQQVVHQYPGRILGIYIRDVSGDKRDKEVKKIAEDVKQKGTEMVLVPDTLEAARHAVQMKWINEHQLIKVEEDCKWDSNE